MVATRFFVSGQVQGVFFRSSARAEAERLGLLGWALNLDDGRVEALAMGSASEIIELAMWLEHGPPGGLLGPRPRTPVGRLEWRAAGARGCSPRAAAGSDVCVRRLLRLGAR